MAILLLESLVIVAFPPVGLHEDSVDVVQGHGLSLVSDRFQQGGQAEVSGAAQRSFGVPADERRGVFVEGALAESAAVELRGYELSGLVGVELFEHDGVGDSGLYVFVDRELDASDQLGLAYEYEVVVLGKVLEEQAQLSQGMHVHEVGFFDDGDEHFAALVDAVGFFDEALFAFEGVAVGIYIEGLREDFYGVELHMLRRRAHCAWIPDEVSQESRIGFARY